jgi:hypothetical protein
MTWQRWILGLLVLVVLYTLVWWFSPPVGRQV